MQRSEWVNKEGKLKRFGLTSTHRSHRKGCMPLRVPMPDRRRPVITTQNKRPATMVDTLAEKRFVALVLLYVVLAENRPQLGIRALHVNYSL